jgi:hypothetical protein
MEATTQSLITSHGSYMECGSPAAAFRNDSQAAIVGKVQ